jgi:hypothetical protein
LRAALAGHLQDLRAKSIEQLLEERSSKIAGFGVFTEVDG